MAITASAVIKIGASVLSNEKTRNLLGWVLTAEPGNSLDPIRIKAVFFALCFGDEAPSKREAGRFTGCFYASPSGITCPLPLAVAYDNLTSELGRPVTEDEKANAAHVYTMVAAPSVSSAGAGVRYLAGGDSALDIDVSIFADPGTKNADDLAAYAVNAWESGWGYCETAKQSFCSLTAKSA